MSGHKNHSSPPPFDSICRLTDRKDAKEVWFLNEVVRVVETRLNSPLLMAEIAECTNFSERWLYGRFKFLTGYSVAQYTRRRKLTLAAALLRHTRLILTDIAVMYGFSSLQQFSRAFRNQFHCAPSQYRYADVWDMSYSQPILFYTRKKISCRFFSHKNEASIPHLSQLKKIRINLGEDYINEYHNNSFTYNKSLYEALISLYEKKRHMTHYFITGELIPGHHSDAELLYHTELMPPLTSHLTYLPTGKYFEINTSGTREEFAKIHMYDCFNTLSLNRCLLRRKPMYTFFQLLEGNVYELRIIYPCANELLPNTLES